MLCKSEFSPWHGENLNFHYSAVLMSSKSEFSPRHGENLNFHHAVV